MTNFQKRFLSSIILFPLALYFIAHGSFMLMFLTTICFVVACYEWQMMTKKKSYKIYGFIFLIFSFYTFYELSLEIFYGFFVIIICISTDIGGYVFGKIFKGPKLTKISPNKTISGSLGSFILSMLISSILLGYIFNTELLNNIFLGFFVSLSVQLGDLFFSYLKRKSSLKNTGNILPGHGGVLDRIDGILLGMPVGLLYILILVFTG